MVLILGDQGGDAVEISETICQERMELTIQEKHMSTSWHRDLGFLVKSATAFFGEKLYTFQSSCISSSHHKKCFVEKAEKNFFHHRQIKKIAASADANDSQPSRIMCRNK